MKAPPPDPLLPFLIGWSAIFVAGGLAALKEERKERARQEQLRQDQLRQIGARRADAAPAAR